MPKHTEAPAEEMVAAWEAQAAEQGFGPAAVEVLRRRGGGFDDAVAARRDYVAAAVREHRRAANESLRSPGAIRALVFEQAAGRLRLAEALPLLEQAAPSA